MKGWMIATALLTTSPLYAAEVITLTNGREVKLNDDFTWEYVLPSEGRQAKTDAASTTELNAAHALAAPAITSIPVITNALTTSVKVNSTRASMQLSDSGVDVLIGAANYENGELVLPTSLTNQSSQAVIQVAVEVQILTQSGKPLAKGTVIVWQSIKRLADTYLRPQQAAQGKSIKLAVPQSEQYQLLAKVLTVETR